MNDTDVIEGTATDASYRVTAGELRQFIERFERLEAEKKDLAEQQKEVMAEAKARGYDTRVMRKVIALRKLNFVGAKLGINCCVATLHRDFNVGANRATDRKVVDLRYHQILLLNKV